MIVARVDGVFVHPCLVCLQKAKYKKKLKEKSSQISEMRQLHCIQMMEIKTEMEKLMEENENLSGEFTEPVR